MNDDSTLSDLPPKDSSALHLSEQVRSLAIGLRDKTRATEFAEDSSILADEVSKLCEFVSEVYEKLGNVVANAEHGMPSSGAEAGATIYKREEDRIQRSNHKVSETALDVVKALFMWREPPGGLKKSR